MTENNQTKIEVNAEDLTVETRVLSNDLRVVLCPLQYLHRCSIILNIGAGSRDESAPGSAHLLEHLIFRGSKRFPSLRELSEAFERIGADFNAYTSRECTSFEIMVAPAHIIEAIRLLAESIMHPKFTGIAGERTIILEEILSDYDEDDALINAEDLLLESMFGNSLGRPIAGSPKDLLKVQKSDIRDFYEKYYIASNMVLVIAGKIPMPSATYEAIEEVFGTLSLKPSPKRDERASAPKEMRVLRVKAFEGATQSNLSFAVLGPAPHHPDFPKLEMLARVLDDGMSSRLSRRLVEELSLVYDIEAYISGTREFSLLQIRLSCQHRRVERLLYELFQIFYDLAQEPPTSDEIDRTKKRILWEHAALLDSAAGVAQWLSSNMLQNMNTSLKEHGRRLLSCRAEDLSEMAHEALKQWPQRIAIVGDFSASSAKRLCTKLSERIGLDYALEYLKS